MKQKASLLSLVVVMIMGFGLTACAGTNNTGSNSNASPGASSSSSPGSSASPNEKPFAGKKVSMLLSQNAFTEEFRDVIIPQFKAKTGIDVVVDVLPESGYDTKLIMSLAGGTGEYDVVMSGAKNWSQMVSSEWIIPLDDYYNNSEDEYKNGFSQSLMNTLKVNGNTYAIPNNIGSNLLYYNKEMFEAAGIDPNDPPESLDEMIEYAKKLNKPEQDKYGFVTRGTREGNANSFSWIMMWFLNGGRWVGVEGRPDYAVLDLPEAIKTMDDFKTLTQYSPSGIASYGFQEAQLAMQQGKAAMWIDVASLGPSLEDPAVSSVAGKIGYHVLKGKGEDFTVGSVWAYSITKTAKNKDAAWELIKYITGKEVSLQQILSGTNGSPARADVLELEEVKKVFNEDFIDALKVATSYSNPHYTPLIAEGSEIRSALSVAISEVITGQKESEKAMKEANEQTLAILKKGGYLK
ncbi:ABC transporter substrate-binding protein [Cohnella faecalis]|uniref:ABC transporter substrate-binding protein n=1 Tax=Cohnella faecalis TaxID=2315694 RepID=UPI001314E7D1|nr:sugar ABC transporter substrate-binding protein [Cohnella faecalis]